MNAANHDFAACMRARGETVFPSFHATKDAEGHIGLRVRMQARDFDPTSSAYKKSLKA